jgi:hypothetical protein
MPGCYRVDPDLNLLILEMTGETDFTEVMEVLARMRREAPKDLDILVDLSGVVKSGVTPGQMKDLARTPRPAIPIRVAFVASKPDVYGRARAYQLVYEAQTESSNIGVFHSKAEALGWLRPAASVSKSSSGS